MDPHWASQDDRPSRLAFHPPIAKIVDRVEPPAFKENPVPYPVNIRLRYDDEICRVQHKKHSKCCTVLYCITIMDSACRLADMNHREGRCQGLAQGRGIFV